MDEALINALFIFLLKCKKIFPIFKGCQILAINFNTFHEI